MDYKQQHHHSHVKAKPRLIIHGGAGNIPASMAPEKYQQYKTALLTIIAKTDSYMNTPVPNLGSSHDSHWKLPSALDVASFAMVQLENNPLFNSGHGAVFTRDGINELEASLMVTRGYAKRAVGVTGIQHVKNPILLAKAMLERGEDHLWGRPDQRDPAASDELDIPSAQGHTLLHGESAEILANRYGLELAGPEYFFTQSRWDEHVRALEREKKQKVQQNLDTTAADALPSLATWSPDEYLPQGTCGAVALDEDGTICVATSTGGMTNKLTGRIGDTPSVGAGFWAEEWEDHVKKRDDVSIASPNTLPHSPADWSINSMWGFLENQTRAKIGPIIELSSTLRNVLAECLPIPRSVQYTPLANSRASDTPPAYTDFNSVQQLSRHHLRTTRATAISGTGNGDSFLRIAAVRTVASIARWGGKSTAEALRQVAGPGGELQNSAQDRWGKTGEGEGGMIGIESIVVRHKHSGRVVGCMSEIVQDHNSTGMFRAWIDDEGKGNFQIWRDRGPDTVDLEGFLPREEKGVFV